MSTPLNNGGPAFPFAVQHLQSSYAAPVQGMSLRDWFAGQCGVSAYSPRETFILNHGRAPTAEELAFYIASIRILEAYAMLAAREAKP